MISTFRVLWHCVNVIINNHNHTFTLQKYKTIFLFYVKLYFVDSLKCFYIYFLLLAKQYQNFDLFYE